VGRDIYTIGLALVSGRNMGNSVIVATVDNVIVNLNFYSPWLAMILGVAVVPTGLRIILEVRMVPVCDSIPKLTMAITP
jgi:hypothetical protein